MFTHTGNQRQRVTSSFPQLQEEDHLPLCLRPLPRPQVTTTCPQGRRTISSMLLPSGSKSPESPGFPKTSPPVKLIPVILNAVVAVVLQINPSLNSSVFQKYETICAKNTRRVFWLSLLILVSCCRPTHHIVLLWSDRASPINHLSSC